MGSKIAFSAQKAWDLPSREDEVFCSFHQLSSSPTLTHSQEVLIVHHSIHDEAVTQPIAAGPLGV